MSINAVLITPLNQYTETLERVMETKDDDISIRSIPYPTNNKELLGLYFDTKIAALAIADLVIKVPTKYGNYDPMCLFEISVAKYFNKVIKEINIYNAPKTYISGNVTIKAVQYNGSNDEVIKNLTHPLTFEREERLKGSYVTLRFENNRKFNLFEGDYVVKSDIDESVNIFTEDMFNALFKELPEEESNKEE